MKNMQTCTHLRHKIIEPKCKYVLIEASIQRLNHYLKFGLKYFTKFEDLHFCLILGHIIFLIFPQNPSSMIQQIFMLIQRVIVLYSAYLCVSLVYDNNIYSTSTFSGCKSVATPTSEQP